MTEDRRNLAEDQAAALAWLLPDVTVADVHFARRVLDIRWSARYWGTLTSLVRVAYQLGYVLERTPKPGPALGTRRSLVRLIYTPRTWELLTVDPRPNNPLGPCYGWMWGGQRAWSSRAAWEADVRQCGGVPRWATMLTVRGGTWP